MEVLSFDAIAIAAPVLDVVDGDLVCDYPTDIGMAPPLQRSQGIDDLVDCVISVFSLEVGMAIPLGRVPVWSVEEMSPHVCCFGAFFGWLPCR
jgi:hypothetical protein